jgi:hypothetical protein
MLLYESTDLCDIAALKLLGFDLSSDFNPYLPPSPLLYLTGSLNPKMHLEVALHVYKGRGLPTKA